MADGFHLWSETYDRDMTNIFSVQSEVAQQVATALKLQLGVADTQRLQSKPTANLAAYELYLKGRFHHSQFTEQSLKQAIDLFNQAIALDPAFAKAYAGLAAAYAEVSSVYVPPKEAMPKAKGYVLKALELDESLADAHHSLATIKWWGDWDFPGAEREFNRSFELNPNEARVYWDYAQFLTTLAQSGQREEARKHLDEINQLAGQIYVSPVRIALLHAVLSDRERAFQWLQTAYDGRCDALLGMATSPDFDSHRADPRFAGLLKKVGLAP